MFRLFGKISLKLQKILHLSLQMRPLRCNGILINLTLNSALVKQFSHFKQRDFNMKYLTTTSIIVLLTGCASITNDAFVPMAISFSDGSSGTCQISNKRMAIEAEIPSSPLIRRSDDNLVLNCTTDDGRTGFASVPSSMGGKIVASAVFLDLGITDAITDKHREYPASFVVPVKK